MRHSGRRTKKNGHQTRLRHRSKTFALVYVHEDLSDGRDELRNAIELRCGFYERTEAVAECGMARLFGNIGAAEIVAELADFVADGAVFAGFGEFPGCDELGIGDTPGAPAEEWQWEAWG